jgi:putative oxygen-independent coproporphyrinogen III oxidase
MHPILSFQPNLSSSELSIYIHWPFCKSKCPYCDFNSHVRETISYELWAKSYLKEIEFFKATIKGKYIKSIFFGGGTPSLMPPFIVRQIIEKIAEYGSINIDTEITIEANPTSSEAENFEGYKTSSVNRISIGVQALRAADLKFLGREHNVTEAREVIKLAASTFTRFSFDLIYARPNQTINDWMNELKEALSLAVNHISLYQLTIEKGTPFYKMYKEKKFSLPENELAGQLYEVTNNILKNNGLNNYEISNYARIGEESRHNLCYWRYEDYLGIGPGAHSRISFEQNGTWNMQAFSQVARPESWLQQVDEISTGMQSYNILSKEEILTEILLMGLRLKEGINDTNFKKFFNQDIVNALNIKKLEALQSQNLIEYSASNIKTTAQGFSLLNSILLKLL